MANSEGDDMRMTTGEQLREVAEALKQDQRNYLHEVEQGKARIAELEGLLLESLAFVDVCCWEGKLGSHKLRCRIGEFLSKKELSE